MRFFVSRVRMCNDLRNDNRCSFQALKLYVNGKHSQRATAVISSFFGVLMRHV
jgi:hypothetical protein